MKVALVSPEVVPFAKTGGLADVAGALPKALSKIGVEVVVVMPRYRQVDIARFGLADTGKRIYAEMSGRNIGAQIYEGKMGGAVKAWFIDVPEYYDRENLYGSSEGDYPDNAERFMFFSKAVPETLKAMGFRPDVVHLNDWQSALVALYLRDRYHKDPFFRGTGSLYTVHNLGYQGQFWAYDMHLTGLGPEYFNPEGIEFYGDINLMKAGLVYSDIINTVSKTYSKEIQTPEYGHGMDGVLRMRGHDLYGIVNGIDVEDWDPSTDEEIYQTYGHGDLKGKLANKRELKKELGLAAGPKPLFGIITRLADQKGLDILSEAIGSILSLGVQLVLLGTGEQKYHELYSMLAKKKPRQVSVTLGFNAALARRIYASSDVFLMPSRYEPCGLGQLISLRYGTVPLVRKTGGLADTVKNFNPRTKTGNGFVFSAYSAGALLKSARAAVKAFHDKKAWKGLVLRGMSEDHSWEASAKGYAGLYKKAAARAADRRGR